MQNLGRLSAKNYVPSDADVLQSRRRTDSINETLFKLDQCDIRVVDVEGERLGRKRWAHTFENIGCLVFVVPLSGYDQCLIEDKTSVCFRCVKFGRSKISGQK